MKNKLLIISREQFGYNTDRYKWCELLRESYSITYLSIEHRERYTLSGVNLVYVNGHLPRLFRFLFFYIAVAYWISKTNGIVMMNYFPYCEVFAKLFPKKKIILDFRTMSVLGDSKMREIDNAKRRKSASCFSYVTAISKGVAKQLDLGNNFAGIIPLGADRIDVGDKVYESLHLLYVGTLYNRNIDTTIRGVALAKTLLPEECKITYDIIGDGMGNEKEECEELIKELSISDIVTMHGYVHHSQLEEFYSKCNVGVSYVPISYHYEFQPVTKTFEYALAGLYVIATATFANQEVVNSDNGILIKDNEQSFAEGLVNIYNRRDMIKTQVIRESLSDYSWDRIVNNIMKPIIESL